MSAFRKNKDSVVPFSPSNRAVILQCEVWGWVIHAHGSEYVTMRHPEFTTTKLQLRPSKHYLANGKDDLAQVYKLTTLGDAQKFWSRVSMWRPGEPSPREQESRAKHPAMAPIRNPGPPGKAAVAPMAGGGLALVPAVEPGRQINERLFDALAAEGRTQLTSAELASATGLDRKRVDNGMRRLVERGLAFKVAPGTFSPIAPEPQRTAFWPVMDEPEPATYVAAEPTEPAPEPVVCAPKWSLGMNPPQATDAEFAFADTPSPIPYDAADYHAQLVDQLIECIFPMGIPARNLRAVAVWSEDTERFLKALKP
jgi:hypothetical protein